MASANDPTPATGIQAEAPQTSSTATQAAPPAEATSIPLPPHPKRAPISPERLAAWTRTLDALLAVSVCVLTFFLASFAARNSDLLMDLATGRALLDGSYKFGADPFSFTTQGEYWVNHSWLYDAALYLLYQATGGVGIVVAKALLLVLLAGFVLAIRRPGQSLWIPAVCGALAALAISPRMFVQPVVISYLFLGITLYLLQKPGRNPKSEIRNPKTRKSANFGSRISDFGFGRRHLWLLPVLFLFWVNLDAWYFLGPLTVALYWIGELIQDSFAPVRQGPDQRGRNDHRTFGLVLATGVVACLLSPHHINILIPLDHLLPAQVSGTGAAEIVENDLQFAAMFWGAIDLYKSGGGWSAAGVAYLVLLGISLVSFAANHQDWRGWRILIWAAFASLSIYHARAIPFFAVVGGPIAALNFQDAAVRYLGATPRPTIARQQWAIGGRLLTLLGSLVLIALAWPGWLHATTARGESVGRNVAWRIDIDPSLEKSAKQLAEWHETGVLGPADRGLDFSPDLANACAWYAPAEKGFIDRRLALFQKAAADYLSANKALEMEPEPNPDFKRRLEPLAQLLRENGANHLMFHYTEFQLPRFQDALVLLENDQSRQWTLVYLDGHTVMFSWDDPQKQGPRSRLTQARVSDERQAFGSQKVPPLTDRPAAPEALAWYERYLRPRQPRPLAGDEAALHLQYFDATISHYKQQGQESWLNFQAAGVVGSGALAPLAGEPLFRAIVADTTFELTNPQLLGNRIKVKQKPSGISPRPTGIPNLAVELLNRYVTATPGPVAPPLLAIRACRRALLENPNDALTWYRLDRAYLTLLYRTREREFADRLWLLPYLRQAQRVAALNHAVELEPNLEQAHADLADLYLQMSSRPGQGGYLDLALKHRSEQLRLVIENGPGRREKPENYEARRKQLEDDIDRLDAAVKKAQNDYEVGQVSRPTMKSKAEFALQRGLGGQARDELLHSLEVTVEPDAIPLQLNLMVMTGALEGESGIRIGLDKAREESETTGRKPNLGQIGQAQYTMPVYEWLQVMVAAASGDYRAADEFLEPLIAFREQTHHNYMRNRALIEALFGLRTGNLPYAGLIPTALLDTQFTPMTFWRSFERAYRTESLRQAAATTPYTADIYTLRGILALEAGDIPHATAMFRKVLEVNDPILTPVAKYYVELIDANK
jgi:tetratricopeptide (TPR) repeat protein